jgi:hypothetical protein
MTTGCARTSLRSVEYEIAREGTGIHKERGQSIRGYHLHDGTSEKYQGWVRLVEQDSLEFWSEGYSDEISHRGIKKKTRIPGPVFPLAAVRSLDVRETRATRTALLVAAGVVVVIVVIGLATMDTMSGSMTWSSP